MPRPGLHPRRALPWLLLASLLLSLAGAERDPFDEDEQLRLGSRIQAFKRSQKRLAAFLAASGHPPAPRTPVGDAEAGIVISAGGRRLLANAFVVVKVIREAHRSRLPIEIFFDGPGEHDALLLDALARIPDVFVRDASQLPRPAFLGPWPPLLHGYAKKVFALYSTGFRRVLMLDSDSQPLIPPDSLFKMPEFETHGCVFWPDYWKANTAREAPQAEIYELLEVRPPWWADAGWAAVESGQVLFDKGRLASVLDWALWLNLWAEVTYEFMLGDKDTFELAFLLVGQHAAFHRVPTPPRTALTARDPALGALLHVGMVQSVGGRPAFLHRTSNGKFDPRRSVNEHLRPALVTEPMSVAAAKQFVWDGPLGINTLPADALPDRPPRCAEIAAETAAALRPLLAKGAVSRAVRHVTRRYASCKEHRADPESGAIAALPLQAWGQAGARAVAHSYVAFQELRRLLQRAEGAGGGGSGGGSGGGRKQGRGGA